MGNNSSFSRNFWFPHDMERARLILNYITQIALFVPFLLLFLLPPSIPIRFLVLIPLVLILGVLNIIAMKNFDSKYRNVDASILDYLRRELPIFTMEIFSISMLIPIEQYIPAYFPKYADAISILVYYIVLLLAAFIISPIRSIFSQPLKRFDPEVTERFRIYAEKLGIRHIEIYRVPWTKFKIANAFQVGPLLYYYVFITDYLLDNLTPGEVDFVILHELSHARKHHILKLMLVLSTVIFLLIFMRYLPFDLIANPVLEIVALLSYLYSIITGTPLLIAYVGRRLETQADIDAVSITREPASAISALEKLPGLNALPERTSKYRLLQSHPPIEERTEKIRNLKI